MSGETKASVSGWTIDTLATHYDALRSMQDKLDTERDRRYTEVGVEREKALKIKETADLAALGLAREIQTYKDEKANELREQISSERGLYATKGDLMAAIEKVDAQLKPINDYIASDRGRGAGSAAMWGYIIGGLSLIVSLITIGTFIFITSRPAPQAIYTPAPVGTQLPTVPPNAVPR